MTAGRVFRITRAAREIASIPPDSNSERAKAMRAIRHRFAADADEINLRPLARLSKVRIARRAQGLEVFIKMMDGKARSLGGWERRRRPLFWFLAVRLQALLPARESRRCR